MYFIADFSSISTERVMYVRNALDAILKLQNTSGVIAKKQIIVENKDNECFQKLLYY